MTVKSTSEHHVNFSNNIDSDNFVDFCKLFGDECSDSVSVNTDSDSYDHFSTLPNPEQISRLVNKKNHHGMTTLMFASREGHVKIVAKLLESGARIDDVDERGYTALYYAVREGRNDVAQLLIESGASVDITLNGGFSVLMYAANNGNCDMIRLLSTKLDINAQDDEGLTPLMIVCRNKQVDALQLLLSMRANPSIINKDGSTALCICIQEGFEEGIHLLKRFGVSLDYLGSHEMHSSLYYACSLNLRSIARFLLVSNADFFQFVHASLKSPNSIALRVIDVAIKELWINMSDAVRENILSVCSYYVNTCGRLCMRLLSNHPIPVSTSNVVDILLFCLRILKWNSSDNSIEMNCCPGLWNALDLYMNVLTNQLRRQHNPKNGNTHVGLPYFTKLVITLLDAYTLCFSSRNILFQSNDSPVFYGHQIINFFNRYKGTLEYLNKSYRNVLSCLKYYPAAFYQPEISQV
ncbi:hypothetical protein WA158_000954 [Blastocystis sp. Blastoise]